MLEQAIFDSDNNLWHRADTNKAVKVLGIGEKVPQKYEGIQASTYTEAFERLYGHPPKN